MKGADVIDRLEIRRTAGKAWPRSNDAFARDANHERGEILRGFAAANNRITNDVGTLQWIRVDVRTLQLSDQTQAGTALRFRRLPLQLAQLCL